MLMRLITLLTSLLFCSQLYAATEVIQHLQGTTYASSLAINSEIELRMLRWSEQDEAAELATAYRKYLDDQDSENFIDKLEEQSIKGYFITEEGTGYIVRHAWNEESEEGERIGLIFTPGLKSINPFMWKEPNTNDPGFTLVEIFQDGNEWIARSSINTDITVNENDRLTLSNFDDQPDFAVLFDKNNQSS